MGPLSTLVGIEAARVEEITVIKDCISTKLERIQGATFAHFYSTHSLHTDLHFLSGIILCNLLYFSQQKHHRHFPLSFFFDLIGNGYFNLHHK